MADDPIDEADTAAGEPAPQPPGTFSRRAFLAGAAGTAGIAGAAYLRPRIFRGAPRLRADLLAQITGPGTGPVVNPITGNGPDIYIAAERDTDLTLLDFSFFGFKVEAGSPKSIVPTTADNTIVVQFPPQAIAEGDYAWSGSKLLVDPPPILSDVAGPSRLCFQLLESQSIPLPNMTVQDLLDWSGWGLLVPAVAQVDISLFPNPNQQIPTPTKPSTFQTAIEFPYAVFLAPVVATGETDLFGLGFSTGFTSRSAPLISPPTSTAPEGVVDLWSTTLVGSREEIVINPSATPAPYIPPVSAVWALDYELVEFAPPADATGEHFIQYDFEAPPK